MKDFARKATANAFYGRDKFLFSGMSAYKDGKPPTRFLNRTGEGERDAVVGAIRIIRFKLCSVYIQISTVLPNGNPPLTFCTRNAFRVSINVRRWEAVGILSFVNILLR